MENKINVKLTEEQTKLLIDLPEQGMGYQIVDIKMKNGTVLVEKIVINSTYLHLNKSELIVPTEIEVITLHEKHLE